MEGSMKAGDLLGVLECVPLDKEACCTVTSETLQHINLVETWLSPSHMWKMRHTSWLSSASLPWIGLSTADVICAQEVLPEEMAPSNSLHLTSGCCISYFVLLWLHTMTKATDRKKNYLGYGYRGSVHDGRRGVTAGSQAGSRENTSSNINVKQTESTGSGVYYGFQEEQNII